MLSESCPHRLVLMELGVQVIANGVAADYNGAAVAILQSKRCFLSKNQMNFQSNLLQLQGGGGVHYDNAPCLVSTNSTRHVIVRPGRVPHDNIVPLYHACHVLLLI